ncbi:hypothetical protein WJ968_22370 [Achromobacter xylosoxidans]
MSYPRLPYPPEAFTRGGDFARLLGQRILILDGAMGTMIQRYKLGEADFRGERFAGHGKDLKGDNELLSLVLVGCDRRDPPPVPGGRGRRHRDQHLRRHLHRPGRLRPAGTGLRAEPGIRPIGARGL